MIIAFRIVTTINLFRALKRPCRSSGGKSLASRLGDPSSSTGRHVGFVVDKEALEQVFSDNFGFPC
jgi:hypothetical protein